VGINILEDHIASIFRVENGGNMFLLNAGKHVKDYMASQPIRPQLTIYFLKDGHILGCCAM
jgi:hypothetical protein